MRTEFLKLLKRTVYTSKDHLFCYLFYPEVGAVDFLCYTPDRFESAVFLKIEIVRNAEEKYDDRN